MTGVQTCALPIFGLDPEGKFQRLMAELIGDELSKERAHNLLTRLEEEEIFTKRETILIRSIFSDKILAETSSAPDILRAKMMKEILANMCRDDINI